MYKSQEAQDLWMAGNTAIVDPVARLKSATELFAEVQKMAVASGFKVTAGDPDNGSEFGLRHPRLTALDAWAAIDEAGTIHVGSENDNHSKKRAPLTYDVSAGMFIGTDDDDYFLPSPGERRTKKRPAAAVLSEMMLSHLKPKR